MKIKIKAHIKEKQKKSVKIDTEFIRLDALLKLCDCVQSGGHAKMIIQNGEVRVNDEICLQRGKKMRPGETAEYDNFICKIEKDEN
jgi:ribosome-associated protein